jgi:HprK-related kinase A
MLHAGVLEKNGGAMLFPAWPGSGKSTLCAALSHGDWRLLSDEFALVRPTDLALIPFPRLIALKNESIDVIRAFAPNAVMGPEYPKTRKGTVAHMRPPGKSVALSEITAQARWIVFPNYEAGATLRLKAISKERAFLKLSGNSFNYELIGLRGFETVSRLIESCNCYLLRYSHLEEAVTQLDYLVTQQT